MIAKFLIFFASLQVLHCSEHQNLGPATYEFQNHFPSYGPVSGLTTVTLQGDFQNVKILQAFLRNNLKKTLAGGRTRRNITLECTVPVLHIAEAKEILIITPSISSYIKTLVGIEFTIYIVLKELDAYFTEHTVNTGFVFVYRKDPIITNLYPQTVFLRGGLILTAVGRYLDSVYAPSLYILMERRLYNSQDSSYAVTDVVYFKSPETKVVNSTIMLGYTPNINTSVTPEDEDQAPWVQEEFFTEPQRRKKRSTDDFVNSNTLEFYVGFQLDGVTMYRNLSEGIGPETGRMTIAINPVFHKFKNVLKYNPKKERFISIKGERLNLGARMPDYSISIGNDTCKVVALLSNIIHCVPPSSEPEDDSGKPQVIAQVGYIKVKVGSVEYIGDHAIDVVGLSVGLVVTAVVVISIVVLCIVTLKRKNLII